MNLYIDNPKSKLRVNGNRLVITCVEEGEREIPIGNIDSISINKNVQITSQAICKICDEGIGISWFTGNRFVCQTQGYGKENIIKVRNQFAVLDDKAFALNLARKNVFSKISNQLEYVNRSSLFKPTDIIKVQSNDELMGIEGAYASLYFSELKNRFDEKYGFRKRIKHPATDPVNSVLSFLYTMLYREFTFVISQHGMNSSVGFFHSLRNGHCALSSDLMESLRCEICDRTAVKILENSVEDDDFTVMEDNEIYISKRLKEILISEFHSKLESKVFTGNGFSNDFYGLINQIVSSYENAIESKNADEFQPFIRSDYFA